MKSNFEKFKAARKAFNVKISEAPRLSSDPKAFRIKKELVEESIAFKINKKILSEALELGNFVTNEMLKPRYV